MIDEDRTRQLYGYTSDELKPKSHKLVVSVCEECGKYRVGTKQQYREMCHYCANQTVSQETRQKLSDASKGRKASEATKKEMSLAQMGNKKAIGNTNCLGYKHTEEARKKISEAAKGRTCSNETRQKLSDANKGYKHSEKSKRKMSCAQQGVSLEEWDGFLCEQKYCNHFNESCRERNRDKYARTCFICGKTEEENGKKLSVHHVDMNKEQGCDDHEWKLVPLCSYHHGMVHNDMWSARLMYLINNVWL